MLAAHESALTAALKARPGLQNSVREIGPLPDVPTDRLLTHYATQAPAIYLAAPVLTVVDDLATVRFTLVIMVRNVASRDQARKGSGVELGIDQYFTLVCRSLHAKRIGDATWHVRRAEFADDDLFVRHGLTVLEVSLESSPIELPYEDAADAPLDDFKHWHADIDIAPHAIDSEYGKWLQEPPDHGTDRPDAQADVSLTGGST